MKDILYKELAFSIVGAAQEVHRALGPGFLEAVYEHALEYELQLRGIPFERQRPLRVTYKDHCVGDYRADFLVDNSIILEIKAVAALLPAHEAQALHYLAITGLRLAILLNFGQTSLKFKRIIK